MGTTLRATVGGGLALGVCLLGPTLQAEDRHSRDAARALLQQMEAHQADAVAARHPDKPDRYIAALRLPGQLLVVTATHPSADLVAGRLERGEHRTIYMDLQATPQQDSKFFVHDLNADGLELDGRGQAFDTIYEGRDSLTLDGRWKAAKMKEDAYEARIAAADVRYAQLLTALSGQFARAESTR